MIAERAYTYFRYGYSTEYDTYSVKEKVAPPPLAP